MVHDFALPPASASRPRVIVGMSGGVDSSVAAALLVEKGMDVVGVTLRLYAYRESLEEVEAGKRECHPDSFIEEAKNVAHALKIPHFVLDAQDVFQKTIIDPFMVAYEEGKTPLPCAVCNRDVKTALLHDLMGVMQAEAIATGHYVQRQKAHNVVCIHMGKDPVRDQSFFLFNLTQQQIQVMHFPLGHFSKTETREYAKSLGLEVHKKSASQDLCFISKRSYVDIFRKNGKVETPGDIFHEDGRLLGRHRGLFHYTVGQRQGLGLGGEKDPLYVLAIHAEKNCLVVGPRASLAHRHIFLEHINWLAEDMQSISAPERSHKIHVKIRSSGQPIPASLLLFHGTKGGVVKLSQAEYGISSGQACVFYDGTRLLGGGWIKSSSA